MSKLYVPEKAILKFELTNLRCYCINQQAYAASLSPSGDIWLDTSPNSCKTLVQSNNFEVSSVSCSGQLQFICAKAGETNMVQNKTSV